jgi:outer membrane receptor for ferrienterochelin and colicins
MIVELSVAVKYIISIIIALNFQLLISRDEVLIVEETPSLEELLSTKVSTASKYEQNIFDAPASVTVITSEEINNYGYQTLADVLNKEAGFFLTDDRNYVYLGTRGFQIPDSYNNKVLLLLDGHTVNDAVYGSSFVNNELVLDLQMIDKIEIVRGPGSVLYGTNAMFAVINVITKKGKRVNGIKLSATTGSYSQVKTSLIAGTELSDKTDIKIGFCYGKDDGRDYYFKEFDSVGTNYGKAVDIDNSRYYGGYMAVNYEGFQLSTYYSNHKKNVPTAKYGTVFNSSEFSELDEKRFVELKYDYSINPSLNLNSRIFFDNYHFEGFYPYSDALEEETNESNTIGVELQSILDISENHRITAGLEYSNNYKCNYIQYVKEKETFNVDDPYSVFAIYANDNIQLLGELLDLSFGVSQDFYSNSMKSTNPRVSLIIDPKEGTVFKLLFGQAFRRPNIYETQYYDANYQIKSDNLKPERITTYEIVYDQMITDYLIMSISVYHYDLEDIIENFEIRPELNVFRNFSTTSANGIEFNLNYVYKNINSYFNYSFMKNQSKNNDLKISYPKNLFKFGCSWKPYKELTASMSLTYETERATKSAVETQTPAFLLLNLYFTHEIKFSDNSNEFYNNMALSIRLNNILDTQYYHPTGGESEMDRILQSGFNFDLNLAIKLF